MRFRKFFYLKLVLFLMFTAFIFSYIRDVYYQHEALTCPQQMFDNSLLTQSRVVSDGDTLYMVNVSKSNPYEKSVTVDFSYNGQNGNVFVRLNPRTANRHNPFVVDNKLIYYMDSSFGYKRVYDMKKIPKGADVRIIYTFYLKDNIYDKGFGNNSYVDFFVMKDGLEPKPLVDDLIDTNDYLICPKMIKIK